ncbi:MAG: CBS domain-containing protein, partial [Rhodospirillales bacterium]|nr:CBS domain-containing protein [Rhodospirillales bacterium]
MLSKQSGQTALPQDFKILPAHSLSPGNTIADALEHIGDRYGAIVTVADEVNRLLGVVSAGDLRKKILNGHGVDTPLEQVFNREPITITDTDVKNPERFSRV